MSDIVPGSSHVFSVSYETEDGGWMLADRKVPLSSKHSRRTSFANALLQLVALNHIKNGTTYSMSNAQNRNVFCF